MIWEAPKAADRLAILFENPKYAEMEWNFHGSGTRSSLVKYALEGYLCVDANVNTLVLLVAKCNSIVDESDDAMRC